MTTSKAKVSIWSNNEFLTEFLKSFRAEDIQFCDYKTNQVVDYDSIFVDLSVDLVDTTQKILSIYLHARENKRKLLVVLLCDISGSDEKIIQIKKLLFDISKEENIHRIIICQDIYSLDSNSAIFPLDIALEKSIIKNEIFVTQKGNFYYYPIHLLDLFEVIKKALFLSNTSGKEFYLQGDKISDIDIAYLLKDLILENYKKELDINNNRLSNSLKKDYSSESLKTLALLNLDIKSNFYESLKQLVQKTENPQNLIVDSKKQGKIFQKIHNSSLYRIYHKLNSYKNQNPVEDIKKYLSQKSAQIIERGLAVVCLIYLAISAIFMISSYYSLKNIEVSLFNLKKGNVEKSVNALNLSVINKNISLSNYQLLSPIVRFFSINFDKTNQNFLNFIEFTQNSIQGFQQTYLLAEKVYGSIGSVESMENYDQIVLALKSNLQQSFESINQIEILLEKGDLPKPLIQKVKQAVEYKDLHNSQEQIGEIVKMVDLLPEVLGYKSASNIFILVQNDHEQRATGGAIDHVVQLSLDKGKKVYSKVFIPSEIDLVDDFTLLPPPQIEKITGNSIWKLRDMNYNPDYPQTATNISWYLEKKLKTKADVIVSINTQVLENILGSKTEFTKSLSNLTSEEYKQKLDQGEGQVHTKDILEKLIIELFEHKIPTPELSKHISDTFMGGNIYLWTSNTEIEKNILGLPFSGAVQYNNCHSSMSSARICLSETTHLNFSNFSLIPLNNYLQKDITHFVTPMVLSVDHEIKVNYKYLKSAPLVNRELVEVVQLYLPKSSIISEILLNDQIISLTNVSMVSEATLNRFQFVISTPLNKNNILSIKYTTPLKERVVLPVAYSFTDIRQSGLIKSENTLEINIPDMARASAITSEVQNSPAKIIFKSEKGNLNFGVNFVPR
jgi:hypothetical protein